MRLICVTQLKTAVRLRVLLALIVGLISAKAMAVSEPESQETIKFQPCRIGAEPTTVPAECGTLDVSFTHNLTPPLTPGAPAQPAENSSPSKPVPKSIQLSIARLPARQKQTASDPVTIIAGGPGQGAQSTWPQLAAAFYPIRANRDVYLIDQRGTGNSAPMICPQALPGTSFSLDLTIVEDAAKACLESQQLPTEWFTTSVAVRDLDAVRVALGIETWNLYGVSYGTRVAQHYLRQFPEHTSSLILDAVVPPQKPIGPELPLHAQQSLDALTLRCVNDAGCNQAFPNFEQKISTLFSSLKATPREVQFENVSRGSLETMTFSNHHLAMSVRLLSYSSYGTAILPSMLYEAAENDNLAPFARQVALQESQLGSSMATGMHAAVICTEDAPFIVSMANRSALQETYLGDFIVDAMIANCSAWPQGVIDEGFHKPVISDVPVLALSGSVDPITPPSYAELALTQLSNSKHIVNDHQAHTQAPLGCMPTVMFQFIETKEPKNLDETCLQRLQPPALFVDANGPLP